MKPRYLILTVLLLATSVFGQSRPPKDVPSSLSLIFRLEARDMISAAEAMPEDKYDFKPTAGAFSNVRTFAEQLKHVACANLGFAAEVRKQTPPERCDVGGGPDPSRTKAEILRYLRNSYAQVEQVISETTPENMLNPCQGPYGCPNTRLGVLSVAIWHSGDHYGQVVEYLRMNGIVPPASQPQQQSSPSAELSTSEAAAAGSTVRVGEGVIKGNLLQSEPAICPALAQQARISGNVIMHAVIGQDGLVQGLRAVSGHPMLIQPAMNTVRHWTFRPWLLNGEPVVVETTITMPFNCVN